MDLINKYDPNFKEAMKVNLLVDGLLPEIKRKIFGKFDTCDEVLEELRNHETVKTSDESLPIFALYPDSQQSSHHYNQRRQSYTPPSFDPNNQPGIRLRHQFNPYPPPRYQNHVSRPRFSQNQTWTPRFTQNQTWTPRTQNNLYPRLPQGPRLCFHCSSPDHVIRYCPIRPVYTNYHQQQPSAPSKNLEGRTG